ncbi:hypothetical protein PanWU01x14_193990, partial [Parasponia andersonii]
RSTGQGPTKEKSCLCVFLESKSNIDHGRGSSFRSHRPACFHLAFRRLDEEVKLAKDVDEDVRQVKTNKKGALQKLENYIYSFDGKD